PIHTRGLAPALRVMSRSEPPAFASGSCPSTRVAPAWLTTTFASTCGTWLVGATSSSGADGSVAWGEGPGSPTNPWEKAQASGLVSLVGVRNHVAPSKSPDDACAAPCTSLPAIGWPPTKRGEPPAAATTPPLVEPVSDTVVSSPVAASTAATCSASTDTGA